MLDYSTTPGAGGGLPAISADMTTTQDERDQANVNRMLAFADAQGINVPGGGFNSPNALAAAIRKARTHQQQDIASFFNPFSQFGQNIGQNSGPMMQNAMHYYQQMLNAGMVPLGSWMGYNPAAPLQHMMPWALPTPQLQMGG